MYKNLSTEDLEKMLEDMGLHARSKGQVLTSQEFQFCTHDKEENTSCSDGNKNVNYDKK